MAMKSIVVRCAQLAISLSRSWRSEKASTNGNRQRCSLTDRLRPKRLGACISWVSLNLSTLSTVCSFQMRRWSSGERLDGARALDRRSLMLRARRDWWSSWRMSGTRPSRSFGGAVGDPVSGRSFSQALMSAFDPKRTLADQFRPSVFRRQLEASPPRAAPDRSRSFA